MVLEAYSAQNEVNKLRVYEQDQDKGRVELPSARAGQEKKLAQEVQKPLLVQSPVDHRTIQQIDFAKVIFIRFVASLISI